MPNGTERELRTVAALLCDRLCTFEFSIAAEIFGLERPEFGDEWYRFCTASEERTPLRANGGITVTAERDLSALDEAGTIVIPGWHTRDEPGSPAISASLRRAWEEGARFVSICSGAFLLAQLGLLDGRRAATHWVYADKLQARFPEVDVDPEVLFVEDGQLFTSAGSAAGIDLCMHIVRKDWGVAKANAVARRLVMQPHRDGDQRQFIRAPVAPKPGNRLHGLIERLRASPQSDWTVDAMAEASAMSRRTFIRRFRDATNRTPGDFLLDIRLEVAKDLLETGLESIELVATEAGFGSLATMQHHFSRRLGCSPTAYRKRFGVKEKEKAARSTAAFARS